MRQESDNKARNKKQEIQKLLKKWQQAYYLLKICSLCLFFSKIIPPHVWHKKKHETRRTI